MMCGFGHLIQLMGTLLVVPTGLLTDRRPPPQFDPVDLLWRREVPLKVSVFAWRLFRSRLPTKVNLFRRRIIPSDAQWCVTGCGIQESENHLFLNCGVFGQIWQLVCNWLGVCAADPSNVMDHFFQFSTSSGYATSRRPFMSVIWFASTWIVWKERNDRLFRGKENSPIQLLEKIKLLSFWWLKSNFKVFHYNFHFWCQNPFVCVGIG